MDKIFIVGMPGSSKSTMGRYLCSQNNFKYLDLDEEIEKKTQMTVKEIFENKDEDYFRSLETDLLEEIIQKENSFILATGGGTPYFNNNMTLINNSGISLFIDVDKKILFERISKNDKSPLLKKTDSLEEKISEIYNERISFYKKSKHHLKSNIKNQALSIINSYS